MRIALETESRRGELHDYITTFPHATFFHTPTWIGILERSYPGFRPFWITAREGGALAGVMPVVQVSKGPFKSIWALPFGTYGDPIAGDGGTAKALIERFVELARGSSCIEAGAYLFRTDIDGGIPPGIEPILEECMLIDLDGGFEEFLRRGLHRKRRQICNRADDLGVVVRPLESEEELGRFYDIYRADAVSWGGVHPYPFRLFHELFLSRDAGVIFWGGFFEGRLLGCHVDMYTGQMGQAWQAGMSREADRYGIGVVLIREAVRYACERGSRVFNLGSSGGNEGILFFKESVGGREYRFPVIRMRKRWWGWLRGR